MPADPGAHVGLPRVCVRALAGASPEGIEGRTQVPGQCSANTLTFALPGHQANSLLLLGQRVLSQQNATCRAWEVAPRPPGWLEAQDCISNLPLGSQAGARA